ncbi:MAG: histidine kinase, partial [Actinomycetia bacterium]|nr:histidine kinase [Actinomycetes bacterium]
MAQNRATAGWDRVLPTLKLGHLPAVLPDRRDGKDQAIQVLDAGNRVVSATRQLVGRPPIATLRSTDTGVRTQRTLCHPVGLKGCMTVVMFKIYSQPGGIWLIDVAVPWIPWYGTSTALFLVIGASLLMTVMVTAGTFRDLTKAMGPVNAIQTELAEITATGLDRRVPVPRKYEEIKLLAETANATLDRLEGAY